ncbi:TrbI/VirB10 family protein [Hephaestia mangrovi]|uniref:TrbI/VirB10 family protein n=1 Tax=Hephaestia mangrovi TaxID=2873268 RepID=UPI002103B8BF|nr:TrbI/VirB10 family protein [Hephaestia mangrovi]
MASGLPEADPRREPEAIAERDVRPMVERPRAGLSGLAIGAIAIVAAIILFVMLDARRRALMAPATVARSGAVAEPAPPPLYIPPAPPPPPAATPTPEPAVAPPPPPPEPQPSPQVVYLPPPVSQPQPAPPRNTGGQALVVDNGRASAPPPASGGSNSGATSADAVPGAASTERVHAAMLANRTTTVPQGTLIPAVLETGLNSDHPGFARALVQRDVRGFDGKQVLIPRGSRLIGQYAGAVAQGQKRAFILWSRLIRPDGVTIAIGSPAADPVGTGGVKADVNSHFFARFSGAILQSVLDVGVNLASRSSHSPVVVALPGSLQGTTGTLVQPTQIAPTLKVKPGASISIFVARDLDFSGADANQ